MKMGTVFPSCSMKAQNPDMPIPSVCVWIPWRISLCFPDVHWKLHQMRGYDRVKYLSVPSAGRLNKGEGQLFILFGVYLISEFFNGFTLQLLIALLLYHVSLLQFWYNFLLCFHLGILGCHSFFEVMSWYMYIMNAVPLLSKTSLSQLK